MFGIINVFGASDKPVTIKEGSRLGALAVRGCVVGFIECIQTVDSASSSSILEKF